MDVMREDGNGNIIRVGEYDVIQWEDVVKCT